MSRLFSPVIVTILTFCIVSSAYAQDPQAWKRKLIRVSWYKTGWFLEGNIGTRTFGRVSEGVESSPRPALNGSIGYIFNSVFALKGRTDYYQHLTRPGFGDNLESRTHSVSLSLIGQADLVPLFKGRKGRNFNFNVYAGSGLTSSWNPDWREYWLSENDEFIDPFIPGADDMGHFIFGINPQFFLNSRVAINLDMSGFLLIAQDRSYDYNTKYDKVLGGISTFSLGLFILPYW